MKTEQRDENTPAASPSLVEDKSAGSFRRVLKNRSFLLQESLVFTALVGTAPFADRV